MPERSRRATARVPGHVTAFFSPHPDDDPAAAGSRGAGIAVSEGVEVSVEPAPDADGGAAVRLDGGPVEMPPVRRTVAGIGAGVPLRVEIESDLPVGAGFGVSGAASLGAALAANAACDLGRSENALVAAAHVAEVEAGTGLGDVVAQARGGVPIRLEPGAPEHGRLDGIPAAARVEHVTFGELSTAAVLDAPGADIAAAGERALERLVDDPRPATMFAAAREFAAGSGLLVPEVREAIDAVDDAGGEAAMAMLGRTVVALGTGLSDAGYDPSVGRIDPAGARLTTG